MQTAVKGVGGVLGEVVGDVVRFPLWWYTTGVVHAATVLLHSVKYYARSLGIAVWIRNIFVPMFGQHDWQGRIISVFMRSAQIFFRGVALGIYAIVALALFVLYVAVPLCAFAFFLFHISAIFL